MSLIDKEEASSFHPINGSVFVMVRDEEKRSKIGSVIMPPSGENDAKRGSVIAISNSKYKDKDGNEIDVNIGDEILFKKWSGVELNHEIKGKVFSVSFSDIFGIKKGEKI